MNAGLVGPVGGVEGYVHALGVRFHGNNGRLRVWNRRIFCENFRWLRFLVQNAEMPGNRADPG